MDSNLFLDRDAHKHLASSPLKKIGFIVERSCNPTISMLIAQELQGQAQFVRRNHVGGSLRGEIDVPRREPLKSSCDASAISEAADTSQGPSILAGPTQISASNGFAWARRRKDDSVLKRSYSRSSARSQVSALDSSSIVFEPHATDANGSTMHELRKLGIELDQDDSFEVLVLRANTSRSEVESMK